VARITYLFTCPRSSNIQHQKAERVKTIIDIYTHSYDNIYNTACNAQLNPDNSKVNIKSAKNMMASTAAKKCYLIFKNDHLIDSDEMANSKVKYQINYKFIASITKQNKVIGNTKKTFTAYQILSFILHYVINLYGDKLMVTMSSMYCH
jgi:hypothetical protein